LDYKNGGKENSLQPKPIPFNLTFLRLKKIDVKHLIDTLYFIVQIRSDQMKSFYAIVSITILSICMLIPALVKSDQVFKIEKPSSSNTSFKHNIQLQLSDPFGVPVPNTKFWVTLQIKKEGSKVTIQLPQINFITGPLANASFERPFLPPMISGGYLYTSEGFLPKGLRPTEIVYPSWLVASNNGLSLPFSFTQSPSTYPVPPSGYIVSITNAGALVVQGAGTFANIIPAGPQILLPTEFSYLVQPKYSLKQNKVLSKGPTNTTQFPGAEEIAGAIVGPAGTGVRDSHFNDAFDGVSAWAWTDNSMIKDKTNGTLNVMVAIGKLNHEGKLKIREPIQLTNLDPGIYAWDTAVAINRSNPQNIVVSYAMLNFPSTPYRAVSFDGGKTWPHNGPMNIQPTGPLKAGDNRGVASDKFGNIWYNSTNGATNTGRTIDQPYFAVSSDGGITFQLIYTLPLPAPGDNGYDYPQYCFGGDGQGNYGLHYTVDYFDGNKDGWPVAGFIPITGLGSFGVPNTPIALTSFRNNLLISSITASEDGRVWRFGSPAGLTPGLAPQPGTSISTLRVVFKSPGPLNQNYAGPWDFAFLNLLSFSLGASTAAAQPVDGFIFNSVQSNLYDDKRKALYQIVAANSPDNSQNMRLYFSISRDNGQTWSNPIDISNTDFANRGFQSMALDPVRGDLYFGWYDGRKDPTYQSLEYYGAVIPAKALNRLVKKIPHSNPVYVLPPAGVPFL
jgi:hypothetical protein